MNKYIAILIVILFISNNNLKSQVINIEMDQIFIEKTFSNKLNGSKINYRLFDSFLHQKNLIDTVQIPLILFLHGAGERGKDNNKQLSWGVNELNQYLEKSKEKAVVIVPQCPLEQQWVEVDWAAKAHTMPKEMSEPLSNAWALVQDYVSKPYVDNNRIIVIGLSMGGYGTWDLLQRFPTEIYSAVPICGGGDPTYSTDMKLNKIWAFHGEEDTVVPYKRSVEMVESLQNIGAPNIRFTSFPFVGHNSWSPAFAMTELWDWVFK